MKTGFITQNNEIIGEFSEFHNGKVCVCWLYIISSCVLFDSMDDCIQTICSPDPDNGIMINYN